MQSAQYPNRLGQTFIRLVDLTGRVDYLIFDKLSSENRFGKASKHCISLKSLHNMQFTLESGHISTTMIFTDSHFECRRWDSQLGRSFPVKAQVTQPNSLRQKAFEFLELPSIAWNILVGSRPDAGEGSWLCYQW